MLRDEDVVRLRHMLDAAGDALGFAKGRCRADLNSDRMLTFALVRAIEVIGEAAAKVTPQGRSEAPTIPWGAVVGMRNRIVHAYYDIDLDVVWDTLTHDLPALVSELRSALVAYQDRPSA